MPRLLIRFILADYKTRTLINSGLLYLKLKTITYYQKPGLYQNIAECIFSLIKKLILIMLRNFISKQNENSLLRSIIICIWWYAKSMLNDGCSLMVKENSNFNSSFHFFKSKHYLLLGRLKNIDFEKIRTGGLVYF